MLTEVFITLRTPAVKVICMSLLVESSEVRLAQLKAPQGTHFFGHLSFAPHDLSFRPKDLKNKVYSKKVLQINKLETITLSVGLANPFRTMHLNERSQKQIHYIFIYTLGQQDGPICHHLLFFCTSCSQHRQLVRSPPTVALLGQLLSFFLGYNHIALPVVSVIRVGLGQLDSFLGANQVNQTWTPPQQTSQMAN